MLTKEEIKSNLLSLKWEAEKELSVLKDWDFSPETIHKMDISYGLKSEALACVLGIKDCAEVAYRLAVLAMQKIDKPIPHSRVLFGKLDKWYNNFTSYNPIPIEYIKNCEAEQEGLLDKSKKPKLNLSWYVAHTVGNTYEIFNLASINNMTTLTYKEVREQALWHLRRVLGCTLALGYEKESYIIISTLIQ